MTLAFVISAAIGGLVWTGLVVLARFLESGPREDFGSRLGWRVAQMYASVWHGLRVEGLEHVPADGRLVIVANHTCGADPLLIQSQVAFYIRWMMMREMMLPIAARLWEWLEIIAVEQNGRDSAALRSAIRHLDRGGVIGVFPEGGVSRPYGSIMVFQPGVGLLAQRKGVRVLPIAISGTPNAHNAFLSLIIPSRARLRILPVRRYDTGNFSAEQIADDLRTAIADALGRTLAPAASASADRSQH